MSSSQKIPEIVVESPQTQRRAPPVIMAPPAVPRERKKMAVTHGHSMANWMAKIKNEPKKPPSNRVISPEELKQHNTRESCWMVLRGKVFDVTDYIDYHPGGLPYIMKGAGQDATKMFNQVHNYVNFENILQNRQVGLFVSSEPAIAGQPAGKGQGQGAGLCCTLCPGATVGEENLPITTFDQDDSTVQLKVESPNLNNMDPNHWCVAIQKKQNLLIKLVTRPPEVWLAHYKLYEKLSNDALKFSFENQFTKLVITLEKPTKTKWKSMGSTVKPHNKIMNSLEAPKDYYPATIIHKEKVGPGHYFFAVNTGEEVHLGIPVGWHIRMKIGDVDKPYTPVKFLTSKQSTTYEEVEANAKGQVHFFLLRIFPDGKFTQLLDKVPLETPGQLELGAVAGKFDTDCMYETDRLIILAGGTGVAPFTSIIKYIKDRRRDIKVKQVILALSVKTQDDLMWHEAWQALVNFGWFHYFPYLSESSGSDWTGNAGHVSPVSIKANLDEIPEPPEANNPMRVRGMASGPIGFNDTARIIFDSLGLKDEDLIMFDG